MTPHCARLWLTLSFRRLDPTSISTPLLLFTFSQTECYSPKHTRLFRKMDVQLYVYDLSQGMARKYSRMLTGVQIDAIYHTAIVFNHVEYFFGQGVHRKVPGSTHHGRPIKVVPL